VAGDPSVPREISCVQILNGCKRRLEGSEKTVISDLLDLIKTHDPDLILLPMPIPGFLDCSQSKKVWSGADLQSNWLV